MILDDPYLLSKLESMVSDILTSCRSNIKQKVCQLCFENGCAIERPVDRLRTHSRIRKTTGCFMLVS